MQSGIEERKVYKTPDGAVFDTLTEASTHVIKMNLMEKIDRDIYCRDTSAEEIADWIVANLEFVIK